MRHEGGCLCGAVRFVLEAPLRPLLGEAYRAAVEEEAAQLRALHARIPPRR